MKQLKKCFVKHGRLRWIRMSTKKASDDPLKMCLFFSMFFFNIFVIHISHTYREGESSADVLTLPE